MILEIFDSLSKALTLSPAVAVGASFAWGVFSIVLSPCHLSSIPLIVGFISGQSGTLSTKRAFMLSLLFSTGILITIGIIGAVTAAAGRMLGDIGSIGNYIIAAIFFLMGFILLDVIPMPFSGPGKVGLKKKGLLSAFILGLVFGVALGPCTFAFMAPVLGVVLKVTATAPIFGVVLLLAYGIGHCSVIVFAGTFSKIVQRFLNWNEKSKGASYLKRVCGILVILGGFYLIFGR
ncbi:MAG: cytochrome c biogenesis protein CcdA [Candidatus Firestonebacteria bacterium]